MRSYLRHILTAWWVNAENCTALIASVRNIAKHMGMKSADTDKESYILQYVYNQLSKHTGFRQRRCPQVAQRLAQLIRSHY